MNPIHYRNDFEVDVTLTMGGEPVGVPSYDFDLVFFTSCGGRRYTCSRRGDVWTNCKAGDGVVRCFLDNHGLWPGSLLCEFWAYTPNTDFADGDQRIVTPAPLGIELTEAASDDDAVTAEVAVDILAVIADANSAAGLANEAATSANSAAGAANIAAAAANAAAAAAVPGEDGRGIVSITKTATAGLVDTYTITYTDGTTSTFEVTNGQDGGGSSINVVDALDSTSATDALSANQGRVLKGMVDGKQDTLTFDTAPTADSTNPVTSGGVYTALGGKQDNALIVTLTYNAGTYIADKTYNEITAAIQAGRNVLVFSSVSQDYATLSRATSGKVEFSHIESVGSQMMGQFFVCNSNNTWATSSKTIQQELVSGTTIKTINSTSLLGSGDIAVTTPTDLATYCPIIEDTRSSAVAAITGVAPFATLVDGQRIVLRLAYATVNNSTLSLNGGTAYDVYGTWVSQAPNKNISGIAAGSLIPLIFEASNNRWLMMGNKDTNTTYYAMSQAEIDAGSVTSSRVITPKLLCNNFQKLTAIVTIPSGAIAPTDGYEPNKMYDFGKVSRVTFAAYDTSKEIANAVNLYMCTFVVASGGTTLNLNANIKYPNGDDGTELTNLLTEEDRVFEITIRDNKLSYLYFD